MKPDKNPIKNLLKLLLKSVGGTAGHLPLKAKRLLALLPQTIAFNDTLSRWSYILMEEIFRDVNEPVILTKKRFKVFDSSINYNMGLDLSNDLQRAYYFQNYGQDLLGIMK